MLNLGVGVFSLLPTMAPFGQSPPFAKLRACFEVGTGKRGHYERGLFTGGISRISKFSRKWSDSSLFSTVWVFSRISRISKFSRISRKRDFSEKIPFPKDPFFRTRRRGFRHYSTKIARLTPLNSLERGVESSYLCVDAR